MISNVSFMTSQFKSTAFAIAIACMALMLSPLKLSAQSTPAATDSVPSTPWGIAISAGIGAVYSSFGAEYSVELMHGHFLLAFKGGGSLPDDGGYTSSYDPYYSVVFDPKEYVGDFAILAGYRIHSNSGWLSFAGGPAYIGGMLRGKNFLSADTNSTYDFFSSPSITNHYNAVRLNLLGFTGLVEGGFIFASWLGLGIGISVTTNGNFTYAGIMMSWYLGRLR